MTNEPIPFKAFEFVCNVLETPLGHNYRWEPDSPEEKERFNIAHRYHELKRKHPDWSFSITTTIRVPPVASSWATPGTTLSNDEVLPRWKLTTTS